MLDTDLLNHLRDNPDDLRVSLERVCENLEDHATTAMTDMLETLWAEGVFTSEIIDTNVRSKIAALNAKVSDIQAGVARLAALLTSITEGMDEFERGQNHLLSALHQNLSADVYALVMAALEQPEAKDAA